MNIYLVHLKLRAGAEALSSWPPLFGMIVHIAPREAWVADPQMYSRANALRLCGRWLKDFGDRVEAEVVEYVPKEVQP